MMEKLIINSGGPISRKAIEDFKKRNNIQLPDDYEKFLLESNWIEFNSNASFPIDNWPEDDSMCIENLYGITESSDLNLYSNNSYLEDLPKGLLAIGDTGTGDYILMSVGQNNFGSIYFWDASHWGKNKGQTLFLCLIVSENFLNQFI